MKKKLKLLGIIAMVVVIGFAMIGCSSGCMMESCEVTAREDSWLGFACSDSGCSAGDALGTPSAGAASGATITCDC